MTEDQIAAVETVLDLLLDAGERQGGLDEAQGAAVTALGQLLGDAGGLALMSRVLNALLDRKPGSETWRETAIDHRFSGISGWAS